ncbi:hypothetical protein BGZ65_005376 [Modicella reniformis]|uniref:Uncharacterized protein n=1 Tax=Modicella reniformis TaxID=1440133 RepID=A0A9P6IXF3_9FUNG|nr:hypothetical protein BGZ65_005376 [Modicella reniformis]
MCGFSYVLKKRARFYELISYKGIRIAITVLFVLIMLFPSGYVMKICVLLSGYGDFPGTATAAATTTTTGITPANYLQSLRKISSNMDGMTIFPICKAGSNRLSFGKKMPSSRIGRVAAAPAGAIAASTAIRHDDRGAGAQGATTSGAAIKSTPSHFILLFPGPYGPHISNSNLYGSSHQTQDDLLSSSSSSSPSFTPSSKSSSQTSTHRNQHEHQKENPKYSLIQGSWVWLAAASIDIMGSSQAYATMLLHSFTNDRLWHFLLCRLQHLHLGFFLLGSASNVYMACKMLSDMYDLVVPPPHSRNVKRVFLLQASIFVIWFWFSYNLMAFRVSTTEEEFMSELPLWALRWINVGVAIVDLSYR